MSLVLTVFFIAAMVATPITSVAMAETTTAGRHCSPNISCIIGKSVELSATKWYCIDTIIHAAFNKSAADNNTTSPMIDAKFKAAANTLATEIGLNLCLSSQG